MTANKIVLTAGSAVAIAAIVLANRAKSPARATARLSDEARHLSHHSLFLNPGCPYCQSV